MNTYLETCPSEKKGWGKIFSHQGDIEILVAFLPQAPAASPSSLIWPSKTFSKVYFSIRYFGLQQALASNSETF